MELKRVSFNVAKTIKDAGYPQENCDEYLNKYGAVDFYLGHNIARPTYLDVWLWLWREKKECIDILSAHNHNALVYINNELKGFDDPEEAIIAAIDYLVDNALLK